MLDSEASISAVFFHATTPSTILLIMVQKFIPHIIAFWSCYFYICANIFYEEFLGKHPSQ